MTVMALAEAIAAAIERLSRPGVEGWGLRVFGDMQDAGDMVTLTPHDGHPPAPERRWIPRDGRLIELGYDWEDEDTLVRYYAHIIGDEDRKSTRLNSSHVKISYAVVCVR